MSAGWRAARESRRPHTRRKLKARRGKNRVSPARRRSIRDAMRALRLKGIL